MIIYLACTAGVSCEKGACLGDFDHLKREVHLADAWVDGFDPSWAEQNPPLFKSSMQLSVKAGARILRAHTPAGIRLCRQLGAEIQVWGVIQPSGKILQLHEFEESELLQHFAAASSALMEGAPDALLIQGFSDLEEALIALRAAKECPLPIGVTLAFGSGADDINTVLEQSCEQAAVDLCTAGAHAVGAHGILDIDRMVLIIHLMRQKTGVPLIACPEGGQKELDGERIVHREEPQVFASKLESLISAGANVVGGASGITPEHIRAAVERLRGN